MMGLLGNDWLTRILGWGCGTYERERERALHYVGVDYGLKLKRGSQEGVWLLGIWDGIRLDWFGFDMEEKRESKP